MRIITKLALAFSLLFISIISPSAGFKPVSNNSANPQLSNTQQLQCFLLAQMDVASLEKAGDTKLSWKERWTFKWLKKQFRKKGLDKLSPEVKLWLEQECFSLHLKTGQIIEVQVLQINPTEIKYKRCGKADDPEIIVSKSDIVSLKDGSGQTLFSNLDGNWSKSGEGKGNNTDLVSKLAGIFGIGSIVFLVLVPFLGIALGVAALVMGLIGLNHIRKNPQLKGEGWAITGIVGGGLIILLLALAIILIASIW